MIMDYDFLNGFRNEDMNIPETLDDAKMTLQVIDDSLLDIVDVDDDVRQRPGFNMETYKKGLLNIYTHLEALKSFVEIQMDVIGDIADEYDPQEIESQTIAIEDFEDDIFDTEQVFELACMLTDESFTLPRLIWYDENMVPRAYVEPSPEQILAGYVSKRRPKS